MQFLDYSSTTRTSETTAEHAQREIEAAVGMADWTRAAEAAMVLTALVLLNQYPLEEA